MRRVLEQIAINNGKKDRHQVKRMLIIYEEQELFIGDSCIIFDKFKAGKLFFTNATVDINFSVPQHIGCYQALLKGNPFIDAIYDLDWEEIDYTAYDVVICMTSREEQLLQAISDRHEEALLNGTFTTAVFSFSRQVMGEEENSTIVFPFYETFFEFSKANPGPMELYITPEETAWANTWLAENGLKPGEKLLILLDSTSVRSKLLKMTTYYELLMWLVKLPDIKILIYDEGKIGKDKFYKELLGKALAEKFIFSSGLELRKAIALLSADKTKLIFGPCTGLMHCASGIYNFFTRTGLNGRSVPLLVTYTGKYHKKNENAAYWWSNAPLMHCLLLRSRNGLKEMVLLNEINETEKHILNATYDCSEYTSGMMIGFLSKYLQ